MALPPLPGDLVDDFVCAGLAGGVVDDQGRAFSRKMFGDGGSDSLGGSGDDGDFAGEFLGIR